MINITMQNSTQHVILNAPENPQERYFLMRDRVLNLYPQAKILIFCKTIQECKNIHVSLEGEGFAVESLHRQKVCQAMSNFSMPVKDRIYRNDKS